MIMTFLKYVPYDPAVWSGWWSAAMTTIRNAVSVGFIIFGVLFCIGLFRSVFRKFL